MTVFNQTMNETGRNRATVVFIAVSLGIFLLLGTPPAALLVFAGGFNGLILPLGLTIFVYVGWRRADIMGGHGTPTWLLVLGAVTCALTWYMGYKSIGPIFAFLGL
ncbi:Mn2+/Fe2+ transporter, NRAMP family [plant metagenome]|uniref:Mn2+/Fe2+ transporter, NRAMP family n=1 Tax=plant metagenome TaxID=1297885 RepID=A0A484ULI0_9ZZZZ